MVTTIQINERTLVLLKKLKEEMNALSYDEAINRMVLKKENSIKGIFGRKSTKQILNNLRDKNDRF